jgi:hypothetical protein
MGAILVAAAVCSAGCSSEREKGRSGPRREPASEPGRGGRELSIARPIASKTIRTRPRPDATPGEWATVRSIPELLGLLEQDRNNAVVLNVRAASAVPCIALERKVFSAEEVRQRLAGFTKIAVDVSEGDRDAKALMRRLKVKTLPAVLVYRRALPLVKFLRDPQGKIRPWPSVLIESSVDVEGFLERMGRVGAR